MLSFLPSALLTAVGYVKGKKLFKKNQPHQKSTMDQQLHNGDTELLTLAEEGVRLQWKRNKISPP